MIFVAKIVQHNTGNSYAFGRIFSGKITKGQKAFVIGRYNPEKMSNVTEITVDSILVSVGRNLEEFEDCPCGNLVLLGGLENHISKSGVISSDREAYTICGMPSSSTNFAFQIKIEPRRPSDVTNLRIQMDRLSQANTECKVICEQEHGNCILYGNILSHLENLIEDLSERCNFPIVCSEPAINLKETVLQKSSEISVGESPDKTYKILSSACPIPEEIMRLISPSRSLAAIISANEYTWDKEQEGKTCIFSPENVETNILTSHINSQTTNDYCRLGAFQITTKGVICEEELYGVKFSILDATTPDESPKIGQLLPTICASLRGALISATPRLMEPIYSVHIIIPQNGDVGAVFDVLRRRKGRIESSEIRPGTALYVLQGFLPAAESARVHEEIRMVSRGQAFVQLGFSYWQMIDEDPFDPSTRAYALASAARARKNIA